MERENVQPIEKIFPEFARRDRLLQIAVGRGEDAHIHLDRVRAADPFKLALLQDAQQFGLAAESGFR